MELNTHLTKRVAIIGGGITGMAAAYTLQEKAYSTGTPITFVLFEKDSYLGGKIQSDHEDGFIIEGGPDSFISQKPWATQLAQSLGLEQDLIGTNPNKKKLYVVNRGRLTPMPDGVMMIIPTRFMPFITSSLISWPGKIRMGMDIFIPGRKDDEDESLGNFIRRRLGSEALDKIAEPLMSGIHVSDPEQQSIMGTFPRFRNIEKKHGSLIRGMLAQRRTAHSNGSSNNGHAPATPSWKNSMFISLKGGMGQLVNALEQRLEGGEIHTGCEVTAIKPLANGYQITTGDGASLKVDAIILASPAFSASDLVAPFAPMLSDELARIRYVSTATVSLAYQDVDLHRMQDGVGFIIPRRENLMITACTASSIKFESRSPENVKLLRCFIGGPGKEEAVERSDDEIIAGVRADLEHLLGITRKPILARVYRWMKGNAQYDVGHLERMKNIHTLSTNTPGLYLCGAAYDGIGIPDCIHQGQQAAENAFAFLTNN